MSEIEIHVKRKRRVAEVVPVAPVEEVRPHKRRKKERKGNHNTSWLDYRDDGEDIAGEDPAISLPAVDEGAAKFSKVGIVDERLLLAVEKTISSERCTRVQELGIPVLLGGENALIQSETGSGKTLTFLLPMIQSLLSRGRIERGAGIYGLVLAPSRELSLQTYSVLEKLLQPFPYLIPCLLVGGEKKKSEKARLRRGVHIVVATPGRLLDHVEHTQCFRLDSVRYFVLDEADMLLDMGFMTPIRRLITRMNSAQPAHTLNRSNCYISATLSPKLQQLAEVSLHQPVYLNARTGGIVRGAEVGGLAGTDDYTVPDGLVQHVVSVRAKERLLALIAFLFIQVDQRDRRVLVFVSSIAEVEFLYSALGSLQAGCLMHRGGDDQRLIAAPLHRMHGDLSQTERKAVYSHYGKASKGILLATDVACRGLDLPHIDWIVQFSPSSHAADYVHRVGRTARLGRTGRALLFLQPSESEYITHLAERHGVHLLQEDVAGMMARFRREVGAQSLSPEAQIQLELQRLVTQSKGMGNDTLFDKAVRAFRAFVRAYAVHSRDTKHIFKIAKLHLGHVAKCFGLEDAPSTLPASAPGTMQAIQARMGRDEDAPKEVVHLRKKRRATKGVFDGYRAFSEFAE